MTSGLRGDVMAGVRGDSNEVGRGQTSLVSLAVAFLLLVAVVGVALALASGALASAQRSPADRHTAAATAERLVGTDSPVTRRQNVLNGSTVRNLSVADVTAAVPSLGSAAFRIELDGTTLAERGDPADGATIRRIVLVATETPRTRTIDPTSDVTLPRRTEQIQFDFENASVETIRINGRIVLHRESGLFGTETVRVTRRETLRLGFDSTASGTLTVTTVPVETRKATLEVTVDVS